MKIISQPNKVKETIEDLFKKNHNEPIEFIYSEKLFDYFLKTKEFLIDFRSIDKKDYMIQGNIRLFRIEKRRGMYQMIIRPNSNSNSHRSFNINHLI